MWNCYQRVLDGEERTNNSIEAWHRQFEVDSYFKNLLKQHHTEVLKVQLDAGDSYEKRKGTWERDLKTRDVVLENNSNVMPGYFEKLALIFSRE
jgi:hypothetical protein